MAGLRNSALRSAAAAAVLAVLVAPGAARAADVPGTPPDGAAIVEITATGTGCHPTANSVTTTWKDATGFSVRYGDLAAGTRLGVRKQCSLSVLLSIPDGYQAALQSVETRGFVALARGASATQRTKTYWQGSLQDLAWERKWRGPIEDNFVNEEVADAARLDWSPCDVNRRLNTQIDLRVERGTSGPLADNLIELYAPDDEPNAHYRLVWQRCR